MRKRLAKKHWKRNRGKALKQAAGDYLAAGIAARLYGPEDFAGAISRALRLAAARAHLFAVATNRFNKPRGRVTEGTVRALLGPEQGLTTGGSKKPG